MVDQKSDDRVAEAGDGAAVPGDGAADSRDRVAVEGVAEEVVEGALAAAAASLTAEAVAMVRGWLNAGGGETAASERRSGGHPESVAAQFDALLRAPGGLTFVTDFVDGVLRPEDSSVGAAGLERLNALRPEFLPGRARSALRVGSTVGEALPWAVVPTSKRMLRRMVAHLVLEATPSKLGEAVARHALSGARLQLEPWGEAVLGESGAARRRAALANLLARRDVDHVLVSVPDLVPNLSVWGFDETVERAAEVLVPLYEQALGGHGAPPTLITLDLSEARDLALTIAVLQSILSRPALLGLEAGITVPVGAPGALRALSQVQRWAGIRVAAGGAPLTVRLVTRAPAWSQPVDAREQVATAPAVGREGGSYGDDGSDGSLARLLRVALTPEHTDALQVVVAGQNLFEAAFATLLAERRGVADRLSVELQLGVSADLAVAVGRRAHALLVNAPVVAPRDFPASSSLLARRIAEEARDENLLASAFDPAVHQPVFVRERDRFLASSAEVAPGAPGASGAPSASTALDPLDPSDRARVRDILTRAEASRLGSGTIAAARIFSPSTLDALVERAAAAGGRGDPETPVARGELLQRAARAVEAARDLFLEVLASETGTVIAESGREVAAAVAAASHTATLVARRERLDGAQLDGARFVPPALVVVAPSWNAPLSSPTAGVFSALAAGAAVVLLPAPEAHRSSAVLCEVLWEAGIPRELLLLVDLGPRASDPLVRQLLTDQRVDRILLTGSSETARLVRSWRPDAPLIAATDSRNTVVVTPSADVDQAVADIVARAFGQAGQHSGAVGLVILVGSAAKSARFSTQLVDAVTALRVGAATDPSSDIGPIIRPAEGRLLDALTKLGDDDHWLVEPRQLDAEGVLWSPGVRSGVAPGSESHRAPAAVPVLSLLHAPTLEAALALQNGTEYGFGTGLYSLDPAEVEFWIATVSAANLFVNTAVVDGVGGMLLAPGWKRSSVGPVGVGGSEAMLALGGWVAEVGAESTDLALGGLDVAVRELVESATAGLDWRQFDFVRRSALSDEEAWGAVFAAREVGEAAGNAGDMAELGDRSVPDVRSVLRHRPVPVVIRLSEGEPFEALVRVLAAGTRARAPLGLSTALKLPRPLRALLKERRVRVFVENDDAWLERVAKVEDGPSRIRMIGGDPRALAEAVGGSLDVTVFAGAVTLAGRVELPPFLAAQTVSVRRDRLGRPSPVAEVRAG